MPYRAFVSSTFEDLKEHRARVIADLQRAGVDVVAMENWTATTADPKTFSRQRFDGCDFCVLLVGLRRGFVPPGESRSITQMEYEEAITRGLDVLVYLVDEDAAWKRAFDETDADPELVGWRRHLTDTHGVEFFDNDPASLRVAPAVARWIAERKAEERASGTGPGGEPGGKAETEPPVAEPEGESDTEPQEKGVLRGLSVDRVVGLVVGIGLGAVALMVVANVIYGNLTEDRHLRSPQPLTLSAYLNDPAHPRAGPLFFLTARPSAEVLLTDLTVTHVDEDSILLEDTTGGGDVLIPGEGMHLLGLSGGQTVSLQIGRLEQTPLGWVPHLPDLDELTWERFDREEVAELGRWKIRTDATVVTGAYIEPTTLSFTDVAPEPDDILSLVELAAREDLSERLDEWNAASSTLAIRGARLTGEGWLGREQPYFIIETGDGLWAAVFYAPQRFSEWYWARDRLEGTEVVARGRPRASGDPELAAINASRAGQLVLILDGYAVSSPDGETVINLGTLNDR